MCPPQARVRDAEAALLQAKEACDAAANEVKLREMEVEDLRSEVQRLTASHLKDEVEHGNSVAHLEEQLAKKIAECRELHQARQRDSVRAACFVFNRSCRCAHCWCTGAAAGGVRRRGGQCGESSRATAAASRAGAASGTLCLKSSSC